MGGFEPPASTSRTWRANQAALHPDIAFTLATPVKYSPALRESSRGFVLDSWGRHTAIYLGKDNGLRTVGLPFPGAHIDRTRS